jgi:hypothetical protein
MYDRDIRDQEGQCLEERLHEVSRTTAMATPHPP